MFQSPVKLEFALQLPSKVAAMASSEATNVELCTAAVY
jgi:hypothetical protein